MNPEPEQENLERGLLNYYRTHPDYDPGKDKNLDYAQAAFAGMIYANYKLDRAVRSGDPLPTEIYVAAATGLIFANIPGGPNLSDVAQARSNLGIAPRASNSDPTVSILDADGKQYVGQSGRKSVLLKPKWDKPG